MVEAVFNETKLEDEFIKAKTDPPVISWQQLNRIMQSVAIEWPDYSGPMPNKALVDQIHRRMFKFHQSLASSFSLKSVLQKALGGPEYLSSGLLTRFGHYIGIYLFYYYFRSLRNQIN